MSELKLEENNVVPQESTSYDEKPVVRYFECSSCNLKEPYEYFGTSPPFVRNYILQEESYVIEDPFVPPKNNEFLVLGSHCIVCSKAICKDNNCSLYCSGTYCIPCAKVNRFNFPKPVQEKLNRII